MGAVNNATIYLLCIALFTSLKDVKDGRNSTIFSCAQLQKSSAYRKINKFITATSGKINVGGIGCKRIHVNKGTMI